LRKINSTFAGDINGQGIWPQSLALDQQL